MTRLSDLLKEAEAIAGQTPPCRARSVGKPVARHVVGIPVQLGEHPRYELLRFDGQRRNGRRVTKPGTARWNARWRSRSSIADLVRKRRSRGSFSTSSEGCRTTVSSEYRDFAYDADQAGDFHFMVMEFVDGVDLSRIVKDKGALPVADACNYIRQAAMGLHHAHECGMVHRDIKPHNLMLTSDGAVKILDFGLASFAPEVLADADTIEAKGDLTSAGSIMGTPDFISPRTGKGRA